MSSMYSSQLAARVRWSEPTAVWLPVAPTPTPTPTPRMALPKGGKQWGDDQGLFKRGRVFYIDKIIKGYGRLRESTGAGDRRDAEDYLARRLAEIGHYVSQGIRLDRTFKEAAAKYLIEMSQMARPEGLEPPTLGFEGPYSTLTN